MYGNWQGMNKEKSFKKFEPDLVNLSEATSLLRSDV